MVRMRRAALVAAILVAAALPSLGAEDLDREKSQCTGSGVTWAQELESCTALIQSGRLNADDQAWAYYRRGFANMVLRQPARALQDLDEAVRLKPDDAEAFMLRGLIEKRSGKDAAAGADMAKACALDPKDDCN